MLIPNTDRVTKMRRYDAELDGFDGLRIVETSEGEFISHVDFLDFKAFVSGLLQGNGVPKDSVEPLLNKFVPRGN